MKKKKIFDFHHQLAIGESGERCFKKCYSSLVPTKSIDLKFDFFLNDGSSVELKTDTYSMDETPNYFMEFYSDTNKGTFGGPWRAFLDKATFFVYYFIRDKTFIWFRPEQLCPILEEIIEKEALTPKNIKNKTWTTQGFTIPRDLLKNVEIRKETFGR